MSRSSYADVDALAAALHLRFSHGTPEPIAKTSEAGKPQRSAFTWRLTPEEANRLDELILRLRAELGVTRLDRATMLTALTALAAESPAVFGALASRLQDV